MMMLFGKTNHHQGRVRTIIVLIDKLIHPPETGWQGPNQDIHREEPGYPPKAIHHVAALPSHISPPSKVLELSIGKLCSELVV